MSVETTTVSPPRRKRPDRRPKEQDSTTRNAVAPTNSIKPLSLRRNFSWTLVGNLADAVCQWGIIILLAKLGSEEMVGQYALGLAIVTPIIMFANLRLRTILATDANGEAEFGHYFALRLVTTALALLVISSIALLAYCRGSVVWVIILVGLSRAIESISEVLHGFCQRHERLDWVAISFMIRGPLSLLTAGLAIAASGSLLVGLIGFILARIIVFVFIDLRFASRLVLGETSFFVCLQKRKEISWKPLLPMWDKRVMATVAWRALPLGITVLLISLSMSIPRYFIEAQIGEKALGIFAALAYFIVAGMTFVFALNQAAVSRLGKYYSSHNELAFRNLLTKLVMLSAGIGVLGIIVSAVGGRVILLTCYGPGYARHADLLVGLMVAGTFLFVANCYNFATTASRRIQYQPVATGFTVVVSVIVSWLLIGHFGLWGAVFATIIVSFTRMVALRLLLPLRGCWT